MHPHNPSTPVYIHSAAALGPHGDTVRSERRVLRGDPPPFELKERVKEIVGVALRQASHLVELAAIGSQLCLKRLPYPAAEHTAVYVGTGLAEVRKNNAIFTQVMPPNSGFASPFDFINAANNMAAFYAAKLAQFRARNLTISQDVFSFEWALQLAAADLRTGDYRQALVGGVDENSQPRVQHLRRIALRDDQPMGEGSGWLLLSVAAEHARGELLDVKRLTHKTDTVQALHAALKIWQRPQEPATLLPGLRIDAAEAEVLAQTWPGLQVQDYLAFCGGFHSAAAFGIAALFDAPATPGLFVHLNRDTSGATMLCAVRVYKSCSTK